MLYKIGRLLQVLGLLVLPSAIWAAQIRRSESASILIFVVACVLFWLGYLLTQSQAKV